MRIRLIASALLLAMAGAPAQAAEPATGFACSFKIGSTLTYDKSKFRRVVAKPIAFEVAGVDLDGQKAELITPQGRGPLRIVRALNANHYLEIVGEGFLNITTIYDRDTKVGNHPAVHSRHFGLFGEPVVAQYQGSCLPK
ncbi:MAG: hypothetical protein ABL904_00175 [Hyphomicrobiaceae bacterium]